MKVRLTYKYNELDKQHQVGLELIKGSIHMYSWLWYYLGRMKCVSPEILHPYPISGSVVDFNYDEEDAEECAIIVAGQIVNLLAP